MNYKLFLLIFISFLFGKIQAYTQSKLPSFSRGIAIVKTAQILADNFRHQESIDTLNIAKEIFVAVKSWNYYAIACSVQGRNYVQLGQFEEVERIVLELNDMIKEKKLNEVLPLYTYFLSGHIKHAKGLYELAVLDFESALEVWNSNEGLKVVEGVPFLNIALKETKGTYFGHIYNAEAFSIMALGDFDKALDYFKQGRVYYKNSVHPADTLMSDINIGSVYIYKGEVDKAIDYFNGIINSVFKIEKNIPYLAIVYNHLANAYHLKKDYEQEEKYLITLRKMFNHPEIKTMLSVSGTSSEIAYCSVLARSARSLANRGMKEQAVKDCKELFTRLKKVKGDLEVLTGVFAQLGEALLICKENELALEVNQWGITLLSPNLQNTKYLENPEADSVYLKLPALALILGKAKALEHMSSKSSETDRLVYLKLGLETAELGVLFIENIRKHLTEASIDNISREGSLFDVEKIASRLFDINVRLAYRLFQETKEEYYKDQAFQACEKSKSYILRQSLNDIKELRGLPQEMLKEMNDLESEIFYTKKRIALAVAQQDKQMEIQLDNQLFIIKEKYAEHLQTIMLNPEAGEKYFDLYNPNVSTISDVQLVLKKTPGASIFEYYESEEEIYLFLISGPITKIFRYDKPKDWIGKIRRLIALNKDIDLIASPVLMKEYIDLNKLCFDLLLKDGLDSLPQEESRLILIPHGMIHHINFGLLLTSFELPEFLEVPNLGYKIVNCSVLDYLVRGFAISYAASSTILLNAIKKSTVVDQYDFSLIGFAPDYESRNQDSPNELPLSELPDEFIHITDFFEPSDVNITKGAQSTEAVFRNIVKQFSTKILHISAHGRIDKNVLFSNLQFAGKPSEQSDKDNILETAELYNLKINAHLAILSACETGDGGYIGGIGKISLARGFAYANCSSIIMSLWDLDADSNLQIIRNFYEQLITNDLPIDQALQLAQLNYIETQQDIWNKSRTMTAAEKEILLESFHPYFWGGLVPMGVVDKLSTN